MAIKYGPNVENLNLIHDKALSKKDGVYLFRGLAYRVVTGKFTHFSYNGEILECAGNFSVSLGKYNGYVCDDSAKKFLRALK